jgi:hypothetical protein
MLATMRSALSGLTRRMLRNPRGPAPRRDRRFRPAVEGLEARECPATNAYDWIGGTSADWNTLANWSKTAGPDAAAVPDFDDDVTMKWSTGKNAPTISDGDYAVKSLTFDSTWDDGGTQTITLANGRDLTISNGLTATAAFFQFDLKDSRFVATVGGVDIYDQPRLITHDATITKGAYFLSGGTATGAKLLIGNGTSATWNVSGKSVTFDVRVELEAGGGNPAVLSLGTFDTGERIFFRGAQASGQLSARLDLWGNSRLLLDGPSGTTAIEQQADYAGNNYNGVTKIVMNISTAEIKRSAGGEITVKMAVESTAGKVTISGASTLTFSPSGTDINTMVQLGSGGSGTVSIERGSELKSTSSSTLLIENCTITVPATAGSDGAAAIITSTAGNIYFTDCTFNLNYVNTTNYSTLELCPAGAGDKVTFGGGTGNTVNVNCIDGSSTTCSKILVNGDFELSGTNDTILGYGVNTGTDPDTEVFNVFEYTGSLSGNWDTKNEHASSPGSLWAGYPDWGTGADAKKFRFKWQ